LLLVLTHAEPAAKKTSMPRAPRIEFAGAIYHVMNRGDHLEAICRDDRDRRRFLETLGESYGLCWINRRLANDRKLRRPSMLSNNKKRSDPFLEVWAFAFK
jgi:hypothetical protein